MLEVRDRLNFEDYLDSLLNSIESDDLEFKSAAGGFPGSFWDTYSAFANSEGGVIVLGVIEKKGKFYIDNLSDEQIEKYTKDFWNNVNNRATVSCNLLKTEDVVVEDYKGHKLMLFFIPRASREQRPVIERLNPTMILLSAIMKVIINVRSEKCSVCFQMRMFLIPLIAAF